MCSGEDIVDNLGLRLRLRTDSDNERRPFEGVCLLVAVYLLLIYVESIEEFDIEMVDSSKIKELRIS